ncbi:MAG: hypothetical protein O2865_17795 [Planctomycetota bacterium]|nr:hypothetical protein [Planctomycetota bacterium]MDA0935433.1 hypothetical protein [Planctomycetota bacterium]MDA1223172.1 hypothetical protein [Planctomycetota bacterium]
MRPNDEHLIRKRSGAREWFRLTKLARSLALALEGSTSDAANGDAPDPWELGLQLARSVHIALGRRRAMAMGSSSQQGVQDAGPWLTAEDVSAAAERALWVCGRADAAVRYAEARASRSRVRRRVLQPRIAPTPSLTAALDVGGSALSPVLPVRLPFDQNGLG